jgi:hypothetical protein
LLVCSTGHRSSFGCSLLERQGFKTLFNVAGGMTGYSAAGFTGECPLCVSPHTAIPRRQGVMNALTAPEWFKVNAWIVIVPVALLLLFPVVQSIRHKKPALRCFGCLALPCERKPVNRRHKRTPAAAFWPARQVDEDA